MKEYVEAVSRVYQILCSNQGNMTVSVAQTIGEALVDADAIARKELERIPAMEKEIDFLKKELAAVPTFPILKKEILDLQDALKLREQECDTLCDRNLNLTEKLAEQTELNQKIAEYGDNFWVMADEYKIKAEAQLAANSRLSQENDALCDKLSTMRKEIFELQGALDGQIKINHDLHSEVAVLKKDLEDQLVVDTMLNAINGNLQKELEATPTLSTMREEISNLKSVISDKQKIIENLCNRNLTEENLNLRNALAGQVKINRELHSEVAVWANWPDKQRTNNVLAQENAKLREEISDMQYEYRVRKHNFNLESERLTKLKDIIALRDAEIARLEKELDNASGANRDLNGKLNRTYESMNHCGDQLTRKDCIISDLVSAMEDMNTRISILEGKTGE